MADLGGGGVIKLAIKAYPICLYSCVVLASYIVTLVLDGRI